MFVGNVYDGQWKAGKKQGWGMYTITGGVERALAAYDGEWRCGRMEGRGTCFYPGGEVEVSGMAADARVGEGARWSADRTQAWRLRDGVMVEEVSLEVASSLASALELPVPTLENEAAQAERIAVALEARMKEIDTCTEPTD